MDGEYHFLYSKYLEFFRDNPQRTSFVDYSFVEEPSFQKKCEDCARFKVFYELDSERNPARKGMKCEYTDHECDGSDNAGCTYCRAPVEEWYYGESSDIISQD